MPVAYINIGSNQGDSQALIERAVSLIEHYAGCKSLRSDYITSEPWGFQSPNRFLNIGIAISVHDTPVKLLHTLQAIERQISPLPHRDDQGNYIDRQIDIDLIAVDDIVLQTPELTLPHPRMHLRRFVLIPMQEIAPEWIHPTLKMSARHLLEKLEC